MTQLGIILWKKKSAWPVFSWTGTYTHYILMTSLFLYYMVFCHFMPPAWKVRRWHLGEIGVTSVDFHFTFIFKNGNRRYKYLVLGHEETYFVKEHSDS